MTSSEVSPALSARLAEVLKLIETARTPLVALTAYGRAPERFPVSRLLDAAPAAESAEEGLQRAARLLTPLTGQPESAGKARENNGIKEAFSLSDLSALHSLGPDLTELRGLLGQALSVAERIDEARGQSYPESIGGSCGWDLAEEVNQLLARVELDSSGPRGKGLE